MFIVMWKYFRDQKQKRNTITTICSICVSNRFGITCIAFTEDLKNF